MGENFMILETKKTILVADNDDKFTTKLFSEANLHTVKCIIVKNEADAQKILSDSQIELSSVFINPEIDNQIGLSIIQSSYKNRPLTPVYFLVSDNTKLPLTTDELRHIGISDIYKKPLDYFYMVKVANHELAEIKSINNIIDSNHSDQQEILNDDAAYISINADTYIAGSKTFFDLFIRIAPNKYLKLLYSGDHLPAERFEHYKSKGIKHFYIRKDNHEKYLKHCQEVADKMIKSTELAAGFRISLVLNSGEETIKFLRNTGISEEKIKYAKKFVESTVHFVQQMKLEKFDEFKSFMNTIQYYEHGVSTAMLAALLANNVEIQLEKPVQIIGLASLFHDIGLTIMINGELSEDVTKMTTEQKVEFYKHPWRGAEIMKQIPDIDPLIIQAIDQHHMRINHRGFPQDKPYHRSRISEIVAVCDEYSQLMIRKKSNPTLDVRNELETKVLNGFSKQIAYAFRSTFFPNTQN